MSRSLSFYFDFISPYAYVAWPKVKSIVKTTPGLTLSPIPVVFAAFLNTYGHKGPAEIPPKRAYIFKDVSRIAHEEGLPMKSPPTHPFNPLLPLRVVTALLDHNNQQPQKLQNAVDDPIAFKAIDGIFHLVWGGGGGVEDPAKVKRVLDAIGLDGAAVLQKAVSPEIKDMLRMNTDGAIKRGAFGVPTMVVDDELFWGFDSLGHLQTHLKGQLPSFEKGVKEWMLTTPSASRT